MRLNHYKYYKDTSYAGDAAVGDLVTMPDLSEWASPQLISFVFNENEYTIDVSGHGSDKILSLNNRDFDELSLYEISKATNLYLCKNPNSGFVHLHPIPKIGIHSLNMIITETKKHAILSIFNYYDGESRRAPHLYVHAITSFDDPSKLVIL